MVQPSGTLDFEDEHQVIVGDVLQDVCLLRDAHPGTQKLVAGDMFFHMLGGVCAFNVADVGVAEWLG